MPRTRTVIFRVSESEYERLRLACLEAGASTLSAYTRNEVLKSIETDSRGLTMPERFQRIDNTLADLKKSLDRVIDKFSVQNQRPAFEDEK
jgi:hypothetical protein